jgi:hypothetical protein
MHMIQEACEAIETVRERDRRLTEAKYWRRNTMRYIDKLLNELELLNLADRVEVPQAIASAVDRLIEECEIVTLAEHSRSTIIESMDILFEIQDSLMFNQLEEE